MVFKKPILAVTFYYLEFESEIFFHVLLYIKIKYGYCYLSQLSTDPIKMMQVEL